MKPADVAVYFTHRRPSRETVTAAAAELGADASPEAVAARIRAARRHIGNPSGGWELDTARLREAVTACYGDHKPWDADGDLRENSGGETWAGRQPDGTEVALLSSSYATYTVTRRDLPGGVRGYHVTARWWD